MRRGNARTPNTSLPKGCPSLTLSALRTIRLPAAVLVRGLIDGLAVSFSVVVTCPHPRRRKLVRCVRQADVSAVGRGCGQRTGGHFGVCSVRSGPGPAMR